VPTTVAVVTRSKHSFLPKASTQSPAAASAVANIAGGAFMLIGLAQLALSPRNVRRAAPDGIDELAALIDSQGLLQPLLVTRADNDADRFMVEAGGRRLRAMQKLAQAGRLAPDAPG
jgi:ParB family chromosome partitioning protein